MKLEMLNDLMIEKLQELYSAENQLVDALPLMAKAAWSNNLRRLLVRHLEQTSQHITRLEQVFRQLNASANGKISKTMAHLFDDLQNIIERDGLPDVVDAALIIVALRMEDYEIAGYAKVGTYAEILGEDLVIPFLEATLNEERQCDVALLELADVIATRQIQKPVPVA